MSSKYILPKLWLQAIPKYWVERRIPNKYPTDTSSEFSRYFNTREISEAVKYMEKNLESDDSILVDIVPENCIISGYLGTYNVSGETNERVLLSPQRVPDNAVGVIAMHYEETSDSWVEINDIELKDGYVYGILDSFSPIAVFTLGKDTFIDTSHELSDNDIFVCNGIPIKIVKNEDNESIIVDSYGRETKLNNMWIVGGTIDGTDVNSTSISAVDIDDLAKIFAGSICTETDKIVNVNSASVYIDNCIFDSLTGNGYNNRMENLSFDIRNSAFTTVIGLSNVYKIGSAKKDSNYGVDLGFGANAYLAKATVKLNNVTGDLVYLGGNNGLSYVHSVNATMTNCHNDTVTTGGSNGYTKSVNLTMEDCYLSGCLQTVNRGKVGYSNITLKNNTIKKVFIGGSTDSDVNGEIESVKYHIKSGNDISLHVGTNKGEVLDSVSAKNIIDSLRVSRTNYIGYLDDANVILKDIIRIK